MQTTSHSLSISKRRANPCQEQTENLNRPWANYKPRTRNYLKASLSREQTNQEQTPNLELNTVANPSKPNRRPTRSRCQRRGGAGKEDVEGVRDAAGGRPRHAHRGKVVGRAGTKPIDRLRADQLSRAERYEPTPTSMLLFLAKWVASWIIGSSTLN